MAREMPTGTGFAARRLQPVPIEESAPSIPLAEPDEQPSALGEDLDAVLLQALRVGVGAFVVAAAVATDIVRRTLDIEQEAHAETGEPPLAALVAGAALGLTIEVASRVTMATIRTAQTIAPWGSWVLSASGVRDTAVRSMEQLNERWRGFAPDAEQAATAFVRELVPEIADAILDRIDLDAMIEERVDTDRLVSRVDVGAIVDRIDLDAIASRLDLDALVATVDLDAVVRRLDLAAIAREVIDELDLPALIRESSEGVTAEAVDDLRYGAIDADRAVARVVDRILRRRQQRPEPPPTTEGGTETA